MEAIETERVEKGWGHELIMCNQPGYCGKSLVIEQGKQCSFHYHRLKDECFFVRAGHVLLFTSPKDCLGPDGGLDLSSPDLVTRVLSPGECVRIPTGLRHRFRGMDFYNELIEISTHHMDDDSIRIAKGD
jgi:mannose-6-phosphate isomerase-like protein (cupin superfamily)